VEDRICEWNNVCEKEELQDGRRTKMGYVLPKFLKCKSIHHSTFHMTKSKSKQNIKSHKQMYFFKKIYKKIYKYPCNAIIN